MGCIGSNCSYNSSGTLGVNGYSSWFSSNNIYYRFAIGSIAYLASAAMNKGVLQKVLIANVKIRANITSVLEPSILYVDQYNWEYNENELCNFDSAKELALLYYESQKIETEKLPPTPYLSKYPSWNVYAYSQYQIQRFLISKF